MVDLINKEAKRRIVDGIREAENRTSGEIRVHLKAKCPEDVMKEAQRTFRRLGMHRTRGRNGVLIFVAWKSRQFAIVGDEGIHRKVGVDFWDRTRDAIRECFSNNDIVGGILAGVASSGEKLKVHFPAAANDKNELSDIVSEGT